MSEKEQEMTSKKLGLHVGDSFQDTREIREVLDKSVFREEEPTGHRINQESHGRNRTVKDKAFVLTMPNQISQNEIHAGK